MVALNIAQYAQQANIGGVGSDSFEDGSYMFLLTKEDLKDNGKGNTRLTFTCKCQDEGFAGRTYLWGFNVKNANADTVRIAFENLGALGLVTGAAQAGSQDTADMLNIPVRLHLTKVERTDQKSLEHKKKTGEPLYGNEVTDLWDAQGVNWKDLQTALAGGSAAPAAAPAAPTPPAAAPTPPTPPAAAPTPPAAAPTPPAAAPAAPAAPTPPAAAPAAPAAPAAAPTPPAAATAAPAAPAAGAAPAAPQWPPVAAT